MRLGGHLSENMQWLSAHDHKDFINSVDVLLWKLTEKQWSGRSLGIIIGWDPKLVFASPTG